MGFKQHFKNWFKRYFNELLFENTSLVHFLRYESFNVIYLAMFHILQIIQTPGLWEAYPYDKINLSNSQEAEYESSCMGSKCSAI